MNKFRKTTTLAFAITLSTAAIGQAQACGEVMYRMGGALRYHAFITRHPAEILIYAGSSAVGRSDAERTKFRDNLEKAGHRVTEVASAEALAQTLATHHYDVIIASAGDMPAVSTQIANAPREPALIPVLERGATNERELRERFPQMVNEDANLNQFLKTIEQSMKGKGA